MEIVVVDSIQKDVKVAIKGTNYYFTDKPIDMPKEHADILVRNDRFKIVKSKKKKESE